IDRGMEPVEVAEAFTVSVSWIYKALGRRRTTGETTARPQRCHVPGKLDLHHDEIRARVAAVPDMTSAELRDWLWTAHGIVVGHAVMWETLKRLGLSLKNVWPAPSATAKSDGVLVCINVSGLRVSALAKMGSARSRPHKDRGVERHIFDQAAE